jgi:hypothetical protein
MANVEDMARAVREAARVVTPGGRFCICVAHPMTDIGLAQHNAENARSYFENACVDETVRRGNLTMTFHGWTYTVEDYARALEGAGFLIERMREPVPATSPGALRPDLERWQRVPLFLFLTAVKRPG